MHESVKEKVSQFVDDELTTGQALALLKAAQQDPTISQTLARYQLIGQALKSEHTIALRSDFVSQIHQQLEQEPTYLLPQRKKTRVPLRTAWAVAASVALVAVLWLSKTHTSALSPQDNILVAQQTLKPLPAVAQQLAAYQPTSSTADSRFNDYLLAHNSSVYTNGGARLQPYTRMATYQE